MPMGVWGFALWGAFGGFMAAALDFIKYVGTPPHCLPWSNKANPRREKVAYLSAAVLRMIVGGGLAAATGTSGYLHDSPLLALAVGLAAPVVAAKLTDVATALFGKSGDTEKAAEGGTAPGATATGATTNAAIEAEDSTSASVEKVADKDTA